MVLTEGFDLPAIGCIVLARPTKQLGLFRQMAGRGLRPAPGKSNLVLIDHSGAVYRHGLLEDKIAWTLDVAKRADNTEHAPLERRGVCRLIECSQCGALRKGGEPCPACGFLPKRRPDAIIFRDGELARVDRNTRQPVQSSDPHERHALVGDALSHRAEQTVPPQLGALQLQGQVRKLAAIRLPYGAVGAYARSAFVGP
jgi:DNA repair protein RadD